MVAAHPYADQDRSPLHPTRRIWRERESFKGLIHRYELFNRRETFAWVAEDALPPLATGDFHRPGTFTWQLLLRCEKEARGESWIVFARAPGSI